MHQLRFLLSVVVILLALGGKALAAEHGGGGGEEGPHPEFAYVKLDPISLPVITARGLTQQVSLMVSLEVPFEQKDSFVTYTPRLTDAYIQDLYGAIGAGFALMKGNIVDVQQIKERLTSVTDKVLGPDLKAHGVLLQVVQQRAM